MWSTELMLPDPVRHHFIHISQVRKENPKVMPLGRARIQFKLWTSWHQTWRLTQATRLGSLKLVLGPPAGGWLWGIFCIFFPLRDHWTTSEGKSGCSTWLQCPVELFPSWAHFTASSSSLHPPDASTCQQALQAQAREPLTCSVSAGQSTVPGRQRWSSSKWRGGKQMAETNRSSLLAPRANLVFSALSLETRSTLTSRHIGHTSEPWYESHAWEKTMVSWNQAELTPRWLTCTYITLGPSASRQPGETSPLRNARGKEYGVSAMKFPPLAKKVVAPSWGASHQDTKGRHLQTRDTVSQNALPPVPSW